MKKLTTDELRYFLIENPYLIGKQCGFDKLTKLHNDWIRKMVLGREDETLQAHRGSYKTTCVSIALAIIIIMFPNDKTMFMRKTDNDVKEIVMQVSRLLVTQTFKTLVYSLYEKELVKDIDNSNEINTNLAIEDPRGIPQLVAIGMGTSVTGKHFDRIFTDDIVTLVDRKSKAEREKTIFYYQELQNIKNRDGRIFNTGTPWHKDDCFNIMPKAIKYDCYTTGLISKEEIEQLQSKMTRGLFSANYELKHIADEDVIFKRAKQGAEPHNVEQGLGHIDAGYGGEDWTAFTIMRKVGTTYYVFGKAYHKHVDECLNDIRLYYNQFMVKKIWCETNADKGYLAKELKNHNMRAVTYHEDMNKYIKITSYLKFAWNDVVFVQGTDEEYIQMILDYNEDAEHDDCPDSCASLIRKLFSKKDRQQYHSIF